MYFIIIVIIGYLFGCINGSQIIGKYKQINIKRNGSKNAGASNTFLLLGWKSALTVTLIDVLKAILSLSFVAWLLTYTNQIFETQLLLLFVNALFVILGHNYPVTMKFNGGKGTASFLGVLIFFNWKFAVIAFIVFLLTSFITNYFVVGTFSAYLLFVTYTSFVYGKGPSYVALILTMFFVVNHADNMKRIINKEEIKLSSLIQRQVTFDRSGK